MLYAMEAAGHPARTQVVDYAFRLAGFVTDHDLYVPLPSPGAESVFIGDAGMRMGCMYVSDVVHLKPSNRDVVAGCESFFQRLAADANEPELRIAKRVTHGKKVVAFVTAAGHAVPVDMHKADAEAAGYLEHINVFAGAPWRDERIAFTEVATKREADVWKVRSAVVKALRVDGDAVTELMSLRSPFHPFSVPERRQRVSAIVHRFAPGGSRKPAALESVTDALLYGQHPLSLQQVVPVDDHGAILISDVDVMSGAVERMFVKRASPFSVPADETQRLVVSSSSGVASHSTTHATIASMWRSVADGRQQETGKKVTGQTVSTKGGQKSVANVDVFAIMGLANRMLHTDAPVPRDSMLNVVKQRMLQDARRDVKGWRKALFAMGGHPTFSRTKSNITVKDAVDAVGKPGYRGGVYDVAALAHYCDINVVVVSSSTKSDQTRRHVIQGAKDPEAPALTLRVNGGALDVILAPDGALFASRR